jgi:hypothetical protein
MSHSAKEMEGRADLAGRRRDSASHRMWKGRRVELKMQNQETGGRRMIG